MIKIFQFIYFTSFLFSVETPSDQYLNSIDVNNKLGDKLSGTIEIVDQDNNTVQLNSLFNNKPTILVMAYYQCPMLCSMVLNGLSSAINESNLNPGEDYQVLTVSIDPSEKSDLSKEKKNSYMMNYFSEVESDFWIFSTADSINIEKLTDELGFRYSYDKNTKQYAHPAVIYILTEDGIISRQLFGVNPTATDLTLAINEASTNSISSIFDKMLLYCYRYNPDAGTYTLIATNVMNLAGASTLVVMLSFLSFFWYRERRRYNVT